MENLPNWMHFYRYSFRLYFLKPPYWRQWPPLHSFYPLPAKWLPVWSIPSCSWWLSWSHLFINLRVLRWRSLFIIWVGLQDWVFRWFWPLPKGMIWVWRIRESNEEKLLFFDWCVSRWLICLLWRHRYCLRSSRCAMVRWCVLFLLNISCF